MPVRVVGELAVIVVGVLLALSADAWVGSLQDRDAERRHLVSLRDDMEHTASELDRVQRLAEGGRHSLLRLLEADLARESVDSVSAWIESGLWRYQVFEPQVASMRDLEASGEIRLLTPEIRLEIAELDQGLAAFRVVMDDIIVSQQGLIDPYLVSRVPLAPVLALSDSLPISQRLPAQPDWSAVQTQEARSLMAFKLSLLNVTFRREVLLSDQIERLTRLIGMRLDELGGGAG